jgi:hypothetical protein
VIARIKELEKSRDCCDMSMVEILEWVLGIRDDDGNLLGDP